MAQRAESRLGETLDVLIEEEAERRPARGYLGRAAHQAPEVDGVTTVRTPARAAGSRPETWSAPW